MAFSFAVKLLAFASTAQAGAVAETPAGALAGEPAPSATTLQQRNLLVRYRYGSGCMNYDNGASFNSFCCFDWQCQKRSLNSKCTGSNYREQYSLPGYCTFDDSSSRYGDGIQWIAANDYGLALTGEMTLSTLLVTMGFFMDLPNKWTKGDYIQLTAVLLQISSATATGLGVTIFRDIRWLVRVSVGAYLASVPILILGMKMKSAMWRTSANARKVKMIGCVEATLLTALFSTARYFSTKDKHYLFDDIGL